MPFNNFTKRPHYLFPVIFSAIVKYKPVTMTNCKYYASLANQKALHKCYCCLFRCWRVYRFPACLWRQCPMYQYQWVLCLQVQEWVLWWWENVPRFVSCRADCYFSISRRSMVMWNVPSVVYRCNFGRKKWKLISTWFGTDVRYFITPLFHSSYLLKSVYTDLMTWLVSCMTKLHVLDHIA